MQPITVAFFGISGSGKGTQCELLEKFFKEKDAAHGVIRPEMGALLRTYMQTGTAMASQVKHILETGGLVPSFMPITLLTTELDRTFDGSQHVILDGTCRRPDQSRAADDIMRMFGRDNLHVVSLSLTQENARKRLELRGRFDDAKPEAIASRFAWYQEQVVPSMNELGTLGWKIHEIDGEPDVETIHQNILKALKLA